MLGYHPILATRASTGEILHARMRKGSADTKRGIKRFIEELVPRLRRAGARGEIVVRVDSGFWSKETIATLGRLGVNYTMAVRTGTKALARATAGIDKDAWADIAYPEGGGGARWPSAPTRDTGSSCGAPAWSVPKPPCGPTDATSPS